jgi:hypothetical protein
MTAEHSVTVEEHHLVFAYCERCYHAALNSALHLKPLEHRTKFFKKLAKGRPLLIERKHLLAYLDGLSSKLSGLLKPHSPYFWLFLYRRIKPVLSPNHDDSTDERTVSLVRQILELAITKYSSFDKTELSRYSDLSFDERWGGYLKLAVDGIDEAHRDKLRAALEGLTSSNTMTPKQFRPGDLRDIYGAEGLAYEYWVCTARLRSIGKGKKLWFEPIASLFTYEDNAVVAEAIRRYDSRINNNTSFYPTFLGTATPDSAKDRVFQLFSASYNVEQVDLSEAFASLNIGSAPDAGGTIFNFVPGFLALDKFIDLHKYVDSLFLAQNKVGFEEFMYVLWAVSSLGLIPIGVLGKGGDAFGFSLLQLLRRGYSVYLGTLSDLGRHIVARLGEYPGLDAGKRTAIEFAVPAALTSDYSLVRSAKRNLTLVGRAASRRNSLS